MRGARLALRGQAALEAGRLDEAKALLESAATDSADVDTLSLDATVRMTLARVHLRRHDPAAAWAALAPAVRRARSAAEPVALRITGSIACAEVVAVPAPAEFAAEHAWLAAQLASWAASRPRAPLATPGASGAADAASPASPLSEREQDVLGRIAAGESNKQIARALALSPHTVKRHVANTLDKLALSSRGQAAAWYRDRAQPGTR